MSQVRCSWNASCSLNQRLICKQFLDRITLSKCKLATHSRITLSKCKLATHSKAMRSVIASSSYGVVSLWKHFVLIEMNLPLESLMQAETPKDLGSIIEQSCIYVAFHKRWCWWWPCSALGWNVASWRVHDRIKM